MNSTLTSSSQGGHQIFTQIVESTLEFSKGSVERHHRVEAAIGLVGEHVRTVHRFQRDGVVKGIVSAGAFPPDGALVRGPSRGSHLSVSCLCRRVWR